MDSKTDSITSVIRQTLVDLYSRKTRFGRMPKKEIKLDFFQASISFPKSPKVVGTIEPLFSKMLSLIKENEKTFPAKLIVKPKQRRIVLDADDFMLNVLFSKGISVRILVSNPSKNLQTVNSIGNTLINFFNTVLGELGTEAEVATGRTMSLEKPFNFARKIVGDVQMSKINEMTKEVLNPSAIMLTYKKGEREFSISNFFSTDEGQNFLSSNTVYKERLPFNLLQIEYDHLADPNRVFSTLLQSEL